MILVKFSQSETPRALTNTDPPLRRLRSDMYPRVSAIRLLFPTPGKPIRVKSLDAVGLSTFCISLNMSFYLPFRAGTLGAVFLSWTSNY